MSTGHASAQFFSFVGDPGVASLCTRLDTLGDIDMTTKLLTLAAALTLGVTAGAHAANSEAQFVLEGYEKAGTPRWIATGRFQELIAQRSSVRGDAFTSTTAATNLCVAYIKTARLQQARMACDRAVSIAKMDRAGSVAWSYASATYLETMARSYSNRAVLNWVTGDMPAAESDLARAAELAPQAHFVAKNVAALSQRGHGAAVVAALAAK